MTRVGRLKVLTLMKLRGELVLLAEVAKRRGAVCTHREAMKEIRRIDRELRGMAQGEEEREEG
jgi:hypothetical protein